MNKCKCGCGQPIIQKSKYYTSEYIRGHNTRGKHYFITFGKPMASSVNTWGHRFGERGIDL